jgi:uncharacterized protein VirK/YbjX
MQNLSPNGSIRLQTIFVSTTFDINKRVEAITPDLHLTADCCVQLKETT